MENKKNRAYQWFIEPKTAHTNEVIVKNLAAVGDLDINQGMEDNLGIPHRVYRVERHSFITELRKAKAKFNLDFYVYSRRGGNGPIWLWTLDNKSKLGIRRVEMATVFCKIRKGKRVVES
ncbi:MAG: hypothetical protein WC545_04435 [Patescibacteria group bacterium]